MHSLSVGKAYKLEAAFCCAAYPPPSLRHVEIRFYANFKINDHEDQPGRSATKALLISEEVRFLFVHSQFAVRCFTRPRIHTGLVYQLQIQVTPEPSAR
jgi:hypothetical protein